MNEYIRKRCASPNVHTTIFLPLLLIFLQDIHVGELILRLKIVNGGVYCKVHESTVNVLSDHAKTQLFYSLHLAY